MKILRSWSLAAILVSGCTKDLIVDFGGGDSVRLVGQADNFDCDDPAFKAVKKVETFTIAFADGTRKKLCKPHPSEPAERPASVR